MKTAIAYPAVYLLTFAPELAALAAGLGISSGLGAGQARLSQIVLLVCGVLAVWAVLTLANDAQLLRTTDGGRRSVRDACSEAADAVAEWAGWFITDTDDEEAAR